MKIGLVCPYNMFKGGGVQECVVALQKEFIALGHDTIILTPKPLKYTGNAPKGMLFIGRATSIYSFKTVSQISASVEPDEVETILRNEKFDILHFHEPWVPMMSRQILVKSSSVNVATFHAKLPNGIMIRTIEKVITPYTRSTLQYINILTAVSGAAAQYVQSITKRKIHIIPNGIDLQKFLKPTKRQSSSANKTILFVGRLEKRKGVKQLLKAFANLSNKNPDVILKIAGEGPDRKQLQKFVDDNKLKNVEFLGYIDEKQKIDLLHNSDVFCSPALYGESFGIVLLEAMASACVTVAGNNDGYLTVLKDAGQLSVVNPKDSKEFSRRLDLMLNDKKIRNTWKQWAKKEVVQYGYKIVAKQYIDVYEQAHSRRNDA